MSNSIKPYIHQVHYYETDKMAVVHHSNYVRWMEEARVDYLEQIGCGYADLEARGVISPVLSFSCNIHESTRFTDKVTIVAHISEYNGVRLKFTYEMHKENGHLAATGASEHCFLNEEGRVVALKRADPTLHERLISMLPK